MNITSILIIAVSLAMDAFAVSLTSGLKLKKVRFSSALYIGAMFGFFQFIMPILGFFSAYFFLDYIQSYSKIISFLMLAFIGLKMCKEALSDEEDDNDFSLSFSYLLPLAIATSIDAMSVGITFALLKVPYFSSSIIIGVITLIISTIGVYLGSALGEKLQSKAELFGGCVLILMGIKILLF